jgi:hypothetical protein
MVRGATYAGSLRVARSAELTADDPDAVDAAPRCSLPQPPFAAPEDSATR